MFFSTRYAFNTSESGLAPSFACAQKYAMAIVSQDIKTVQVSAVKYRYKRIVYLHSMQWALPKNEDSRVICGLFVNHHIHIQPSVYVSSHVSIRSKPWFDHNEPIWYVPTGFICRLDDSYELAHSPRPFGNGRCPTRSCTVLATMPISPAKKAAEMDTRRMPSTGLLILAIFLGTMSGSADAEPCICIAVDGGGA